MVLSCPVTFTTDLSSGLRQESSTLIRRFLREADLSFAISGAAAEHPGHFAETVFSVNAADVRAGTFRSVFLVHQVMGASLACHLREVRNGKHLHPAAHIDDEPAHPVGNAAGDTGVDLVENKGGHAAIACQQRLDA